MEQDTEENVKRLKSEQKSETKTNTNVMFSCFSDDEEELLP